MCGSSIQMETLLRELLVEFLKILLRLGVEAGIVRACLIEFSFLVFENYFLTVILSFFFSGLFILQEAFKITRIKMITFNASL
jgi:hypothetical protein